MTTELRNHLYDAGFFLVEAFAALEVTAVIVANTRITAGLHLREELSSFILTSYLGPLFLVMVLLLAFSRRIAQAAVPRLIFLGGLGLFAFGNMGCALAHTPSAFFAGRAVMGLGGALALAGQLWTLSTFHRSRIVRPLLWGEVGAALGVVAGPLVGALFADHSPGGWRAFFWLNAGLGLLTALLAYLGLQGRGAEPDPVELPDDASGRRMARVMTTWQVAVSILIVGAEYLFSDVLQAKLGYSARVVGGMTVLASLGAILGSLWATRLEHRLVQLPRLAALGLLGALLLLGICLQGRHVVLASVPIFGAGLAMGLASVSIYAVIVKTCRADQFLRRSMVYLLGMQVGNALGVQAVGLTELGHLGPLASALGVGLVPLVLVGVALGMGRRRTLAGSGPRSLHGGTGGEPSAG